MSSQAYFDKPTEMDKKVLTDILMNYQDFNADKLYVQLAMMRLQNWSSAAEHTAFNIQSRWSTGAALCTKYEMGRYIRLGFYKENINWSRYKWHSARLSSLKDVTLEQQHLDILQYLCSCWHVYTGCLNQITFQNIPKHSNIQRYSDSCRPYN